MPTKDQIQLVHAYLDGELDVASALSIKAQIDADPSLAAELARVQALQKVLRERFPPEPVPESFRRRIAATGKVTRVVRPTWAALAASVVLAVFLSGGATWLALRGPASSDLVASELLDSHLRSLAAGKPTEVTTSERHTIKPWFNGRIPEAPRVIDLAKDGFPLLGARVDVIARTPVPTLVYGRRLHVISLVAVPGSGARAPATRSEAGYNTVEWSDGTKRYAATSDLNAEELSTFARLFREAPGS